MSTPKNNRPINNIQMGVLAATSVTFRGVDVCKATYCKVLYPPVPNKPKNAKRRQLGHNRLLRRNTGQANGTNMRKANNQRKRLRVMGGINGDTNRPTTALPAHIKGGTSKRTATHGVILCAVGLDMVRLLLSNKHSVPNDLIHLLFE